MSTVEREIDIEEWARGKGTESLPKARSYKVRLWDGEDFDQKESISDGCPTGAQILAAFQREPAEEYVLLLLDRDGVSEIGLTETIDIRGRGAERFFAFRTDRTFNFLLDGDRYIWGAESISELDLRTVGKVSEKKSIVQDNADESDEVLSTGQQVSLSGSIVEKFYTQKSSWKLKVQGILLTLERPRIVVRDALVKAGINPDTGWTAALKIKGEPREAIGLDQTIDLTRPGIEKLWLRPNHINNGESKPNIDNSFAISVAEQEYLSNRGLSWETAIEGGRRWLILRNYELPPGYSETRVDVAIEFPTLYPAAQLDMFYCNPELKKSNGGTIPQTESRQSIEGISFQRWSRHRSGDTAWNPCRDSLVTHIAIVDEAIRREVEKQ